MESKSYCISRNKTLEAPFLPCPENTGTGCREKLRCHWQQCLDAFYGKELLKVSRKGYCGGSFCRGTVGSAECAPTKLERSERQGCEQEFLAGLKKLS